MAIAYDWTYGGLTPAQRVYMMDSHNVQRVVVEGAEGPMVKNEGNVEVGGFPPYPISYRSITPQHNISSWTPLGAYRFAPGEEAYLEIRADGADGAVLADAVLFVPVEE